MSISPAEPPGPALAMITAVGLIVASTVPSIEMSPPSFPDDVSIVPEIDTLPMDARIVTSLPSPPLPPAVVILPVDASVTVAPVRST